MPGWRVMHLLYLGGAKGGATVGLYQNGDCDEQGYYQNNTYVRLRAYRYNF